MLTARRHETTQGVSSGALVLGCCDEHTAIVLLPVLALGSGAIAAGFHGWLFLGALIILGSKIIWWATEHEWGKFS